MEQAKERERIDGFKIFLRILYTVSLAVYFFFVFDGLSFYQTAVMERPHHQAYRALRPAGIVGHGFGIVGTLMMLFMLLYSVRKRTRLFGEWGSLNRWLDIHIYFGIMGPLFIILHTSFKVNGLIAISFWSMIAVATSGILGRYLYLQIPRNRQGEELSFQQIREMEKEFSQELQEEFDIDEKTIKRVEEQYLVDQERRQGIFKLIMEMIAKDFLPFYYKHKLKRLIEQELGLSNGPLLRAVTLFRRKARFHRRVLLLDQIQRLFHYWHVFHKPFAIIMYVIMLVHVGIAVWLGYTWIF